ncbi:hypothetical protein NT2_05_02070 [Caenibius tardaugens NBRC 16725]|uniref:Uncharacterized protein n=1 Tax=Caenibius tardaugens NBRC 16725 TaxID=1219035 RepID=U2YLL2_9SPHN|nr:DUF6636 domain-containing protein [Caenibius tardaugens]AZI36633.1 hypothetical protein EGO55_12275 [Caenibius tardaugens NBRC 16725]GAD49287.1 hypothetical protein NT2_05_02070 [Caenibius tardaugens NBRC 16725]
MRGRILDWLATGAVALLAGAIMPLAAAGAAPPTSPAIAAGPDGQVVFTTPSNNIGCTFTPAGGTAVYTPRDGGPELVCERVAPRYVTVIIGPKGAVKRIDNPGEQGCCSLDHVLAYGQTWSSGPFTCQSRPTGLTCRRKDGRGFSLSRASVKVF